MEHFADVFGILLCVGLLFVLAVVAEYIWSDYRRNKPPFGGDEI